MTADEVLRVTAQDVEEDVRVVAEDARHAPGEHGRAAP